MCAFSFATRPYIDHNSTLSPAPLTRSRAVSPHCSIMSLALGRTSYSLHPSLSSTLICLHLPFLTAANIQERESYKEKNTCSLFGELAKCSLSSRQHQFITLPKIISVLSCFKRISIHKKIKKGGI